jgi:hypothetical protein
MLLAVAAVGGVVFVSRRGRSAADRAAGDRAFGDLAAIEAAIDPDERTGWRRWLVDAEIFRQTPLWAEIATLAEQTPGREARVMSTARQDSLDGERAARFADFSAAIRGEWPSLTTGDVKLCCLSLLPLTPFARALCFGSTETNIIKQRKHTIKKKLASTPRGRAMFEFIFETRG